MAPQSPANAEELRAMRAAAWHKQGIVVVPLEDIYDEWDRAFLSGIATKLYGARTVASHKSTPWAEGEVIDRGDGETWTVVATTPSGNSGRHGHEQENSTRQGQG